VLIVNSTEGQQVCYPCPSEKRASDVAEDPAGRQLEGSGERAMLEVVKKCPQRVYRTGVIAWLSYVAKRHKNKSLKLKRSSQVYLSFSLVTKSIYVSY